MLDMVHTDRSRSYSRGSSQPLHQGRGFGLNCATRNVMRDSDFDGYSHIDGLDLRPAMAFSRSRAGRASWTGTSYVQFAFWISSSGKAILSVS